jgi:hypothetical protein
MAQLQPAPLIPTRHPTKEPAHLPLHHRLLFPHHPPPQPLPQLIHSTSPESILINEKSVQFTPSPLNRDSADHFRLYLLIALSLRAYILSWYPRFTKDRTLLPLLHQQIILPILTPILQSLNSTDNILHFLLIDLPTILSLHIQVYWASKAATLLRLPRAQRLSEAYHARLPLISITPESTLSPTYLAALADTLLKQTLSEKEYESDVERLMARDVLAYSILGNVGRKLGESWFWWGLGLKLLGEPGRKGEAEEVEQNEDEKIVGFLTKLWIGVLGFCSFSTWANNVLSTAPPIEERYHQCTGPWLLVFREILGIDGPAGPTTRKWGARISWGLIELICNAFTPILDRYVLPFRKYPI